MRIGNLVPAGGAVEAIFEVKAVILHAVEYVAAKYAVPAVFQPHAIAVF